MTVGKIVNGEASGDVASVNGIEFASDVKLLSLGIPRQRQDRHCAPRARQLTHPQRHPYLIGGIVVGNVEDFDEFVAIPVPHLRVEATGDEDVIGTSHGGCGNLHTTVPVRRIEGTDQDDLPTAATTTNFVAFTHAITINTRSRKG
eukprot:CAMPEP_0178526008 /NCGR_PEP_ID=MMETSP0696-20121128/30495_1 /TAXON_ID=265572 /ORGANISM="Extubocellulus spinifer, Strain CCMP396" /LENGTH=145 /DNA_ID=CAMNT_0020157477 /DNA_START=347 /DNA_END=784 /DNA_ORIENTATION=+